MRSLAIALVLYGSCSISTAAWAQNECKVCRETLGYCLKAHSKDACNHDYAVCMKGCRKK
jgi:hypothetical protein